MFVQIKTHTRTSTDTNFFDFQNSDLITEEYRDYWRTNYIITGKCLFVQNELSEDRLVLTSTMMWNTRQDYDNFITDQYIVSGWLNKFVDYNSANNITFEVVSEEEI